MTELSQESVVERAHHALELDESTGQRVIAVLIILVTVLAAGTALLERIASTHQAHADRRARAESVIAVGEEAKTDTTLSEELVLRHAGTNLAHLSADFATEKGPAAAHARARADALAAASRELDGLRGEFFPRFKTKDGFDYDRFYAASLVAGSAAEEWAAAYARERGGYASKRGFYIAVITIFAVSLFLLGLTLTVPLGHRFLFLVAGSAFGLAGVVLGLVTLAQPVKHPSKAAIDAYAQAVSIDASEDNPPVADDRDKFLAVVSASSRAIDFRGDYERAYLLRANNRMYLDLTASGGPTGSDASLRDFERAVGLREDDYFAWVNYADALFWARRFDDAIRANTRALELQPNRPIVNVNQVRDLMLRDAIGTGRVVRGAEYRAQMAQVRRTLGRAPERSRALAVDGLVHDVRLVVEHRPEYAAAARAVLEDVLRIDHTLDATRAKTTPGPYPAAGGRAAITSFAYSNGNMHLDVGVCYVEMTPTDQRLYYVYVDGNRVDTIGPDDWRDPDTGLPLPSTTSRTLGVDLESAPKPGARIRVEVFVDGRLRAERSALAGQPFERLAAC